MKKRILGIILALAMAATMIVGISLTASAEGETSGSLATNVSWSFDTETGVLTISGSGAMPYQSDGSQPYSQYKSQITSVVISEGITSVGGNAFHNFTKITDVSLPSTLKSIGTSAFKRTYFRSITIPNGVTTIESSAFRDSSITSIVLPASVTKIQGSAFQNAYRLKTVEAFGDLTEVGGYAFYECGVLESVTFHGNVATFGNNVFKRASSSKPLTLYYWGTTQPEYGTNLFQTSGSSREVSHAYTHSTFLGYGIKKTTQTYSITVSNDGNGTASADTASYKVGETVSLTATPNDGYRLKEWQIVTGNTTGKVAVVDNSFIMPGCAVEVKAVFELIPTIPVGTVASVTTAGGETSYHTDIAEAIAAAQEADGSTLKLLQSISTDTAIVINSGNFTFDLGVNSITSSSAYGIEVKNNANLKIIGGAIISSNTGIFNAGTLALDNVTITASEVGVYTNGTITIGSGAKISATASGVYNIGTATIDGATISSNRGIAVIDMPGMGRLTLMGEVKLECGGVATDSIYTAHGILDLSGVTGSQVDGWTVSFHSVSTDYDPSVVTLPSGYVFYNAANNKIENAPKNGKYTIGHIYTVDIADSIQNGNVSSDKVNSVAGDTITLTVTPAEGYELDTLTVKDASNNDVTVTENAFTMPASNVTVTATFKAKTYTVTVNTATNGTFVADKTEAEAGDTVTLTVTPAEGYELDTLTVKDASNNDVTVTENAFTMPASNVTVTATFKAKAYTITMNPATNGTFVADKTEAEAGTPVNLVLTPDIGYYTSPATVKVTYTEGGILKEVETYMTRGDNYLAFYMPAADVTISVTFTKLPTVTFTANDAPITNNTVYVGDVIKATVHDAAGEVSYRWYAYDSNNELKLCSEQDSCAVDASYFNENYEFMWVDVYVDDIYVDSCLFEKGELHTVTVTTPTNGTVIADKTEVKAGDTVTLTIAPEDGYELESITVTDENGDPVSVTDNKFTMPESDVTVSATFIQLTADEYYVKVIDWNDSTVQYGEITKLTDADGDGIYTAKVRITLTQAIYLCTVVCDENGNRIPAFSAAIVYFKDSINETVVIDLVVDYNSATNLLTARIDYYSHAIVIKDTENGTLTADKTTVNDGETFTVTITPAPGYVFDKLYFDGNKVPDNEINGGEYTFTVPNDYSVEWIYVRATFEKIPPTYNISTDVLGNGDISVRSSARVGDTVTVTVMHSNGYKLHHITVTDQYGNTIDLIDGTSFVMPDGDVTVSAAFVKNLPRPATVNFSGLVSLMGGELEAGEFTFELSYAFNGKNHVIDTAKNNAEGEFNFAPVEFYAPRTYTFYIKQIEGNDASVDYDTKIFEFTVRIYYGANGRLTADVTGTDGANFVNIYVG